MRCRNLKTENVGIADGVAVLPVEAEVAGDKLESARAQDRAWREERQQRLQAEVNRAGERELQARWVCQVMTYLLANALLIDLIVWAGDSAKGVVGGPFFRVHLPLLLLEVLLAALAVWGACRLLRTRIQREARAVGAEVQIPRALQPGPRGIQPSPLSQAHAVERLLDLYRARSSQNASTGAKSTRGPA